MDIAVALQNFGSDKIPSTRDLRARIDALRPRLLAWWEGYELPEGEAGAPANDGLSDAPLAELAAEEGGAPFIDPDVAWSEERRELVQRFGATATSCPAVPITSSIWPNPSP